MSVGILAMPPALWYELPAALLLASAPPAAPEEAPSLVACVESKSCVSDAASLNRAVFFLSSPLKRPPRKVLFFRPPPPMPKIEPRRGSPGAAPGAPPRTPAPALDARRPPPITEKRRPTYEFRRDARSAASLSFCAWSCAFLMIMSLMRLASRSRTISAVDFLPWSCSSCSCIIFSTACGAPRSCNRSDRHAAEPA